MKKIIIVNGYPSSGKTELEKIITRHIKSTIYSSITPVKAFARQYFGWKGDDEEKTEEWRRFLAELKKMLVEQFDYIYICVRNKIREFYRDVNTEILMIDSREPKEIERFKNCFHAITLFVRNDRVEKITSNSADANVENYKYDYVIENNGTLEELEEKAIRFIKELS